MRGRRALLVPVAGLSERFRGSVGRDVLKCLYHEGSAEDSLLHFTASYASGAGFDVVRYVGGYRYDELTAAAGAARCVFNPEFATRGTAQTLATGLRDVLDDPDVQEVVVLEGDVVGDGETLEALAREPGDVLTTSPEPISARESVVLYRNGDGRLRFAFDPAHRSLRIAGPFSEIHNSGQAWKLADIPRLRRTIDSLTNADLSGTNLVILERYFADSADATLLGFRSWVNCNTLADYRRALPLLQREVTRWKT